MSRRVEEQADIGEFVDAAEVGYIDNEFTPMWWKETSDKRPQRVWAVRDGEKVLLDFFNDGMQFTTVGGLKRGRERAAREIKELQAAGGQQHWPIGYTAMYDGIYSYLTEYRKMTSRYLSDAIW